MAPTGQGGQWQEVLCCSICNQHFSESVLPVSLICGHVICRGCADKSVEHEKPCPSDDWKTTIRPSEYPTNVALLTIIYPQKQGMSFSDSKTETAKRIDQLLCQIAKFFREAESERGGTVTSKELSRTLQRKVLSLLCYQYLEPDGRQKTLKMCRGISERVMIEIILSIQSNIHVSSQLWSAVRARGCQFLGPAMQDDVLRLILMTLETGECIARKNLVMYVVQTLESDYPQVSKTCVGHVVQLLYRASCFNVLKRDGESSLMQLKEEFRTYESLRREHDSQIVQIAFESGLRIGPDQWSALLYADQNHRSHMQSIIDKLQSRSTYLQGIQELRSLSTTPDSMMLPAYRFFLSQVVPCLEFFATSESEEATIDLIAEALHQIRTLLRLHCTQEDQRKQDRRMVRPTYYADPGAVLDKIQKKNPTPPPPPPPPQQQQQQILQNPPPPILPIPPQQQQRRKRYQMGIPPQRQEFLPNFQYHHHQNPNNFYRQIPPPPPPPPQAQMVHQTPNRRHRRIPDHHQPPPIPMLIPPPTYPMMPTGTADVVTSDGQGNESTQRVVIMQSPTHPHTGPVVMIPQQPLVGGPSVTPVPMGPPQWTASPTGNTMIYPAQSPPGQPPHTIWISQEGSMFPTFDYSGGMIWGPTTMLRESGADAEQLLAKRHEILKRLQPSEDDDDPEDGGVGHVSYTVASSVLDDRMDHHPIAMIPVEAIPMAYTPMANEETVTMIGEIVQGRPRAPSLTTAQTAPILMTAASAQASATAVPMVQSECTATVPQPLPLFPLEVPVVPVVPVPETFNPSVPPPPPPQPMLVDSATGLLTPIRPILVAHPQNVVSNSLDKIVDVKERLSEANGCASEAENAHLRMELRMAESEMAHLDPFTKNNCLLRELQQVDRELQQLQIEPARQ